MRSVQINLILLLLLGSLGLNAQLAPDSELYKTVLAHDLKYFKAYNECDLKTQANMYHEDLEFYHDMGGLSTNKDELIKSIERNICGKVTRELVKEDLEIHEIPGYGAVEIGFHKFHNKQEPDALSKPSRFITIWKKEQNKWFMSRIISLHNN